MSSDACKNFLEGDTGIEAAKWKRRSKKKVGGVEVRVFENTENGETVELVEHADGTFGYFGTHTGSAPTAAPVAGSKATRPIEAISVADLEAKILDLIDPDDTWTGVDSGLSNFFNGASKAASDLDGLEVDFENSYAEEEGGRVSFEVLPNGAPVLWVAFGGDWELPVSGVVYFDGKDLRLYVPREGNLINDLTNSAFGNYEAEDEVAAGTQYASFFKKKGIASAGFEDLDKHSLELIDDMKPIRKAEVIASMDLVRTHSR